MPEKSGRARVPSIRSFYFLPASDVRTRARVSPHEQRINLFYEEKFENTQIEGEGQIVPGKLPHCEDCFLFFFFIYLFFVRIARTIFV